MKLESRLAADLAELRALKAKLSGGGGGGGIGAARLRPWDVSYLSAEMKRALGVDNERIKTYFPAAHVVPTAVALVASVLGCAATRVTEGARPWHPSCEVYAVTQTVVVSPSDGACVYFIYRYILCESCSQI